VFGSLLARVVRESIAMISTGRRRNFHRERERERERERDEISF